MLRKPRIKKTVVEHVYHGKCTVAGGWSLESGEPYLDVVCADKTKRKLLLCPLDSSQVYWVTDAETLSNIHTLFEAKELLRRKTLSAKTRTVEANAKEVDPDKRMRAIASAENEVSQLEEYIEELNLDVPEANDEEITGIASSEIAEDPYSQAQYA